MYKDKEQHKEALRKWREQNPEKLKEYAKRDRKTYTKLWIANNPEKNKSSKLKTLYGINLQDYFTLVDKQKGCCAMCGKPPQGKHSSGKDAILHVDHDHTTGKIRGLLCFRCNTNLGTYEKQKELCERYLA